ncbi:MULTISPECIES: hypothetical protein [unclassified Crossiella]|uniref:hypothetical protein n=1 Tax=unclassified Crossiella TaxID=2620835 RepID=UPI0020004D3A|nr:MULTISPECIES: hypothetical protein [unclassified Crossiella]MCK2242146.1 hypothetical protein [Crossiella sp. S99.2]MCK2256049.1 hypothetical protein [Crossiella sp. S99.1]
MRSPYDEDRHIPWLGRDVSPDEVVEVPAEFVENFLAAGWTEADKPAAPRKKAAAEEIVEG